MLHDGNRFKQDVRRDLCGVALNVQSIRTGKTYPDAANQFGLIRSGCAVDVAQIGHYLIGSAYCLQKVAARHSDNVLNVKLLDLQFGSFV